MDNWFSLIIECTRLISSRQVPIKVNSRYIHIDPTKTVDYRKATHYYIMLFIANNF